MRALDALSRRSSHMLCSSLSKSRNNQQKVCAAYRIAGPTCGIAHDSRPSAVISAGGCAGSDESWTMSRSSLEPAGPQNNTKRVSLPCSIERRAPAISTCPMPSDDRDDRSEGASSRRRLTTTEDTTRLRSSNCKPRSRFRNSQQRMAIRDDQGLAGYQKVHTSGYRIEDAAR